jgi:hypothetical protein
MEWPLQGIRSHSIIALTITVLFFMATDEKNLLTLTIKYMFFSIITKNLLPLLRKSNLINLR